MKRLLILILAISPLCAADRAITPQAELPGYNPAYTGPLVTVEQAPTGALYAFVPADQGAVASAPILQVVAAESPEMELVHGPQNRPENETAPAFEQIIDEPGFIEGFVHSTELIGGAVGVALLHLTIAKYNREIILKHIPISMTLSAMVSMLAYCAAQNATATTSVIGNIKNCFENGYSKGWMASSAILGLLGLSFLKC